MKLSKMSLREQVLVLVAVVVVVGGAYGTFRFYPANKAIADLYKNTQMMDSAIKTGKIPDEPFDDIESLQQQQADLDEDLLEAGSRYESIERRLSPDDTTEVRLEISEIARKSLVKINTNEQYRVMVPAPVVADAAGSKAAKNAPKTRMGDGAKRKARAARRASATAGGGIPGIANVSPEQATALIRKMAINGPMERPMQRLTMEGTYAGMMRFIGGLQQMGKLVTIVQFQLAPGTQAPPPGSNQRLTATMVLAL